jgi:conjugative transfer signal peptidase TraF
VSRRAIVLVVMALGLAVLGVAATGAMPVRLIWNASASLPRGFYRVTAAGELRSGDLVLAHTPAEWAATFAARGYLPDGVPLLKRVAAVAGATVCRQGTTILIDGSERAAAQTADRLGRPMPAWSGCRTLAAGEMFLLIAEHPASLDGRYLGPMAASLVIGRAVPLWTVADGR